MIINDIAAECSIDEYPKASDFSKALYTFDIGQNDLAFGFQNLTAGQVRATIPNILTQFSQNIKVSIKYLKILTST